RKGIQHYCPRGVFVDSARTKIEQSFLIELARCTSVRTLHIISPDFQLWLRVHGSLVAKENITVSLERIRFLCIRPYVYLSVENTAGLVVDDAFIKFVAERVRLTVIHYGMVICKCLLADQIQSVHMRVNAFAVKG